jgi:hypothetical protein
MARTRQTGTTTTGRKSMPDARKKLAAKSARKEPIKAPTTRKPYRAKPGSKLSQCFITALH